MLRGEHAIHDVRNKYLRRRLLLNPSKLSALIERLGVPVAPVETGRTYVTANGR